MNIFRIINPALIALIGMCFMHNYAYSEDEQFYSQAPDKVILLHGIGRTALSMSEIGRRFSEEGYEIDNIRYRSTKDTLAKIIGDVHKRIRHYTEKNGPRVHFVCYSLGCLVTRGIIQQHRPRNLGRVVMLGPPNQGSEMADFLKDHALSNWIFGPNLPQLGTANRKTLEKLIGARADYELGIIAGNDWIDPVGASIIPGDNDGRVSVKRTRLPGMKEHLVMGVSHTGMLMNDRVIEEAVAFIKTGSFLHE